MDMNDVLRTASVADCSALTSPILGGHSLSVPLSDGEGSGVPLTHEGPHAALNNTRRTSRVWKYFRMVDNCHYVCCLCNFIGAYTNTTNMRKHIQNHHPEIFQDILDHTRPSNRLHFLRSFQPAIFPSNPSFPSYQHQSPFHLPSSTLPSHHPHMSTPTAPVGHYADSDAGSGVGAEEGDASSFAVPHCSLLPQRDVSFAGENGEEPSLNSNRYKVPNTAQMYKSDLKAELLTESLGEDRKVDLCALTGSNFPPGLNENSLGSGEGQGACDEVSVPLSPEQFLSEEMDQGVSPSTPSQRPESYKLRHNNHLTLVLESLAGDESFMDVTLTAQGRAIKAHKSILSAVSPYFKSVLKENPCQHPIIIMPRDIRFEELNNIISYVYKGEMTVAAEELSSLLKTAEILQVTGLSPTDSGRTASGIISQMQGLPSGMFANTSTNNVSSPAFSSKRTKQSHSQSRPDSKERQQQQVDSQARIDPLEFLNADMTCVKEEIPSDTEEGDQLNFPISKDFPAGPGSSLSEPSDSLGPPDSSHISPSNRRKSLGGSPRPLEDPTGKPFNPGETKGVPIDSPSTPASPTGPHVCPHCSETHRPTDALQSHLRLKHPSKLSFVCSCGRVFVRQTLFSDHQKKCKG